MDPHRVECQPIVAVRTQRNLKLQLKRCHWKQLILISQDFEVESDVWWAVVLTGGRTHLLHTFDPLDRNEAAV